VEQQFRRFLMVPEYSNFNPFAMEITVPIWARVCQPSSNSADSLVNFSVITSQFYSSHSKFQNLDKCYPLTLHIIIDPNTN
jgi:hypothetical protein